MADVATKNKSMNVVSNNSNSLGITNVSDVCSVQSNNGLIDLDSLTAGNNKLRALNDQDQDEENLVYVKNTRNDDKSLQELIESELALRIYSNDNDTAEIEEEEPIDILPQPEIRKIILEPRQDVIDVNLDFIVNEIDHYTLIEEPYQFSNGHANHNGQRTLDPMDTNGHIDHDEEEAFDGQTENTETEPTTTTSGPSLISAIEANVDLEESDKQEEDLSVNTISDTCVIEEVNETHNHIASGSPEKFIQENESIDLCDNVQVDEFINQDDLEVDLSVASDTAEIVSEGSFRNNPRCQIASYTSKLVESEIFEDSLEPNTVYCVEEAISLKEASGVDEKACSFYSTACSPGVDIDNGNSLVIDNTNLDVTDFISKEENCDSWTAVGEVIVQNEDSLRDKTQENTIVSESQGSLEVEHYLEKSFKDEYLAPLATPDEISDISNACDDSESHEVTTSSTVVTSTTKKKKKIVDGNTGSDATTNHTKTKKTKKSKKSELEKENISVKKKIKKKVRDSSMLTSPRQTSTEMIISGEDDLSNVNVKSLTQTYVSERSRSESEKPSKEIIATGISIKQLCRSFGDVSNVNGDDRTVLGSSNNNKEKSSFNKFDALSKKPVLHVRSVDAGKVQQQLNSVGQNGDANANCRSCDKVVFQMEQTKAEGLIWHKNCFRCVQCSKPLNVDNYESHESRLYCKPHFKELFQPKPVEESDQTTSDKPDLGLEELSSLNVKSRFEVFEKANHTDSHSNEIERSPSQVAVKRSPSILSKLAKFQAKGMDIGVQDESLNGIPYEESSESDEEIEEETEETMTEIVKNKRGTRERPISFAKMDDIKNRWEVTSQQGRRESQREARKEEMAGIRSKLFMGKQGKMKELYQQAVADSERVTKINAAEEIQHATNARSIKEIFEKGKPIPHSDDEDESKTKENPDEDVFAAGISKKSRSLFLELDATAAKTGRPVTPVNQQKSVTDSSSRRARDMDSPDREIYRDPEVVRAEDRAEDLVRTDTARKMLSIFRQMEEKATKEDLPDGRKPLKCFTPPPEDKFAKATASDTSEEEDEQEEEDDEEHNNPNYVRASDKLEDEFLKQGQNAKRAKTLRAKFEHWETTDGKTTNHQVVEMDMAQTDGTQPSIESTRSLKARFESLGSQPTELPRTPKVKVNRFVEMQTNCTDVCESCEKKVYPLEKVETNNKIFHKQCFRCLQCNCILRMDTFTLNNGKLYCIPHFKQLFITRGNYDEGFGVDPHKNKWSSTPIAVRNGDV